MAEQPIMKNKKIVPVILSGGFGKRLWPLSRATYPKQLQTLISGKSLLQETVLRVAGSEFYDPIVICNDEHRFIVAQQLHEIGVKPGAIILEPYGRNTAPAIMAAAAFLKDLLEGDVILALPSDHSIGDISKFTKACQLALNPVELGKLVMFGEKIKRVETGFGYIKLDRELKDTPASYAVTNFVEKPIKTRANKIAKSDNYLWNTGIFMFKSDTYIEQLKEFQPDVVKYVNKAVKNKKIDLDFMRLDPQSFFKSPSISIDYAVMEHTDRASVVPVDMNWSDLGSWETLWEISEKDANNNVLIGDILSNSTNNSYIRSEHQSIATLGINNLIIVAMRDAILVANKDCAQELREIVDKLENTGSELHYLHTKVFRPWGWFQTIDQGEQFKVKLIHINPHSKISLQRHKYRAEHWVVILGTAKVTCGKEIFSLSKNESTFIPSAEKHRLENNTDTALRLIEIQTGERLEETDIERFEDDYGRD